MSKNTDPITSIARFTISVKSGGAPIRFLTFVSLVMLFSVERAICIPVFYCAHDMQGGNVYGAIFNRLENAYNDIYDRTFRYVIKNMDSHYENHKLSVKFR